MLYFGLYACNHFTQTSPMRFLHGTSPVDAPESHSSSAPALSVDPLRNPAHVSASTVTGFVINFGFPDLRIQTCLLSYSHALHAGWLVHRLQHACTESTSVKRFANSMAFSSTKPLWAQQRGCLSQVHSQLFPCLLQWKCPNLSILMRS